MTGAPLPPGADSIVPFEETDETGRAAPSKVGHVESRVRIFKAAAPGNNIRHAGEDVRAGEVVLPRGTVLRPAHIGVLASLGRAVVRVTRRPVVAILSTGDEVVEAGQTPGPGQIRNSNGPMLRALAARAGATPRYLGIARDDPAVLARLVRQGLDEGEVEHQPSVDALVEMFGSDAPDGVRLVVCSRIDEADPG
jgi:molybdopterin molybdotransferase